MSRIQKFFSQRSASLGQFPIAHVLLAFLTTLVITNIYIGYDNAFEAESNMLMIASFFALSLTLIPGVLQWIMKKNIAKPMNSWHTIANEWDPVPIPNPKKPAAISAAFLLQICGLAIGFLYYTLLPNNFENSPYASRVWMIGSIILGYLLIFFSIARTKKSNEAFTWTWRKGVIESVLIGWIAGLIIWGGISACIKSIEFLFNVEFSTGNIYEYVGAVSMIFITGSIALLYFTNQENEMPVYTRLHRIFWQYIFLPLTIVYWLILISYGVKILLTWIRPTWTVIYMVMGYIAFGLLTRLTTYPALPNSFISRSHFILFGSFILTSLLMIPAIQMRIDQYGLTIDRYFICAIIVWIMLFSIGGMLFSKHRMIIIISLLIVLWGFSVYWGKWNASSMSANSQKNKLLTLLHEYNISLPLNSWSISDLGYEQKETLLSPLQYLTNSVNVSRLEGILTQKDLIEIKNAGTSYDREWIMCKAIGLSSCYEMKDADRNKWYFNYFIKQRPASINIDGYSTLHNFNCVGWDNSVKIGEISFDFTSYMSGIYLHANTQKNNNIQPMVRNIDGSTQVSDEDKSNNNVYTIETDAIKLYLYEMGGRQKQNEDKSISYKIDYCDGIALVK